jgi:mannosyltransferase
LKIVFNNIVFSFQKAGGISVVWFELIKGFIENKNFECYFVRHVNDNLNLYWSEFNKDSLNFIDHNINKDLARLISPRIEFEEKFIYFTSGYDICQNSNAINVIIIHDFIYEIFGKFRLGTLVNKFIKKRAILKSDIIFCVSNNTKNDLLSRFSKMEETKKIGVVHNGVSEDFKLSIESKSEQIEKYILFVGRRSEYKNFDKIVNALTVNEDFQLKIVSGVNPTTEEIEYLNRVLGQNRYEFLIGVSNEQLKKLYNYAFCLVYPSDYEGFGIPILEAQSSGCPVVTCNNSSISEISGNAVIYLEDLSITSFTKAFKCLEIDSFRNALIERGAENAKNYSWEKMTSEYQNYLEFYIK